jgi:hypothetical protein
MNEQQERKKQREDGDNPVIEEGLERSCEHDSQPSGRHPD